MLFQGNISFRGASLRSANVARVGGVVGLRGGGDWGGCAGEGGMFT